MTHGPVGRKLCCNITTPHCVHARYTSATMSSPAVYAAGSLCGGNIPSASRSESVPTDRRTTTANPAKTAAMLFNVLRLSHFL